MKRDFIHCIEMRCVGWISSPRNSRLCEMQAGSELSKSFLQVAPGPRSMVESELGWGSPGAPLEVPGMAVIPRILRGGLSK